MPSALPLHNNNSLANSHADHSPNKSPLDQRSTQSTLRNTFGVHRLRAGQREVIESVLQRQDTLAVMPTGAGKSLCYQLPALKMPGKTVVVSPLIALMKDQVDKLESAGLPATEINSSLSAREERAALDSLKNADGEFIFATPERLTDPDFLATLKRNPISLFVIDEAHCISQWGHDFRPAYLQLSAIIKALGEPTVLALTATATEKVTADILRQLERPGMRVIDTGIYRPNLHYRVIPVTSDEEQLSHALRVVHETAGTGLIYAATLKIVSQIYEALEQAGASVTWYHGQMPAKIRTENQELFMSGARRVMVATNAFGMGIDKPDIRFVLHYQLPANLEAYYQESGRAGRDGEAADCILLHYPRDRQVQQFFLARRYPGADDIDAVYTALNSTSTAQENVSPEQLQAALDNISDSRLQVVLKLLKDGGYICQDERLCYRLLKRQAKPKELARLADVYRDKSAHDHDALERMVFYAQSGFCRWTVLLEYFGEQADWERCGTCDNCLHPPEQGLAPEHVRELAPPATASTLTNLPELDSAVSVARFGEGRVTAIAGDKITIAFPDSSTRTFLQQYVTKTGDGGE